MTSRVTKAPSAPLVDRQTAAISSLLMEFVRSILYVEDVTAELPLKQLHVCGTLVAGPLTMSELANELGISPSATTQIADRLERAGLVMRTSDGADRRVRCLKLTPAGMRAMKRREAVRQARIAAICKQLSSADRDRIIDAFQTLQQALNDQDSTALHS